MTLLWIFLGAVAGILLFAIGFLLGRRSRLRHGIVWKKEEESLLVRTVGGTRLLKAKSDDNTNRLRYCLFGEIHYVKSGKRQAVLYFSEREVLAILDAQKEGK